MTILSDGEKQVILERYEEKLQTLANALQEEVRDHGSLDWQRTNRRFLNTARRIMWRLR